MKQNNSFVQFVIDQIQDAGNISCKSMFGGFTIYCDEKIVALICNNQLFVKPTEKGRSVIGDVKEAPPYPGAKPCFLIQDNIDDKEWICELIRKTAEELPLTKQKRKSKKLNQGDEGKWTVIRCMSTPLPTVDEKSVE
jgi:TfoX/Sxy family transcriptional regulator of competence genes